MKRRTFLHTATGTAVAVTLGTCPLFAQTAHKRDTTYEPNRPLESTGLQIRDALKILKKGEKNKRMVGGEYDREVLTEEARRSIRDLKIRKAYKAMMLLIVKYL